jgi:DNA-binding MarR family transcriptional regulator
MKIAFPTQTIFYTIENAIKQYRRMSQKQISQIVPDITIDQALILIIVQQHPDYSQVKIAEVLFKDYAAMTRMVERMVVNGYLRRTVHAVDKRRSTLLLTDKGRERIDILMPIIKSNREQALRGIDKEEVTNLNATLQKLIQNCL